MGALQKIGGGLRDLATAMLRVAPIKFWALMGAAPILTVSTAIMVGIVWKGDMTANPADLASKRLDFLGAALLLFVIQTAVIVVTLASVRAKATAPGGIGFEVDADGHPDTPQPSPTAKNETPE